MNRKIYSPEFSQSKSHNSIVLTVLLFLFFFILNQALKAQCTVTATPSSTAICLGTPVSLTASGTAGSTYTWLPTAGLSNPSIANPVANPTVTTVYTVSAVVPAGAETIPNGDFESGNK